MKNWLKRRPASLPGWPWHRWLFVSLTMILLLPHDTGAQNFIVNGTVNNTGSIRVKNQTVISQPGIGGELVLTGADQILPAKNYQHVQLNGTGTKTTSGGNLSISGNLSIAAPVTLRIPQGDIATLGDTLFEFGSLKGAIQKSVDLTGSTTSSNFGNIGATISWSSNAPGVTNVLRASDSMQIANGNQSVKRFYSILTTDTSAVGNVLFKYSDAELNGHDTTIIELWQSNDNGNSWKRRPAVVDAVNRTISKSNVPLKGLWAIADTLRPLGPLTAAGVPAYFTTLTAPAPQSILTQLQPLTVIITDAFGDPIANVPLSFAITSKPQNAVGDTLSVYDTVTDSLGRASTRLTLGNKIGIYSVTATSPTLNPIVVNVAAYAGAPASFAVVSGNNQSDTLLTPVSTPLIVSVRDIGDNPVESTSVYFSITSAPLNATGQVLSADTVLTDSIGNAAVTMTLGNRPGTYTVTASAASIPVTQFTATALKNSPALFARVSGNAQADTILSVLDSSFIVSVKDVRGNPVDSAMVEFAITSFPQGATGQILSASAAATDTNGVAVVSFTLGNKIGQYIVTGTVDSQTIPAVNFSTTALRGPAASFQILAGSNQSGQVLSTLQQPFVISLSDIGGNAADGDTVNFSFISVPAGATQQLLSATTAIIGNDGLASSQLTLGEKTGPYVVGATTSHIAGTQIFTTTAIPGAATAFSSVSGGGQSGTINTVVPQSIDVTVIDALGNGVPNTNVTFTITSAPANAIGQQLTASNVTTSANGTASTQLLLGNKVGPYVVTAAAQGISDVQVTASATAGAASSIIATTGQLQVRPINSRLDTPFVVNVLDVGSNNVPGTAVIFTLVSEPAGATGAQLADSVVYTDSLGIALTYLQLGNKVGEYRVNAKVVVVPLDVRALRDEAVRKSVTTVQSAEIETEFVARASHGAAAMFANLTGSGQLKPTETSLDSAFTLTVYDIGQNAVPNVPVSFSIVSAPALAQGQQLRDTVVTTDSNGFVSNAFVLGDLEGTYTISASVNGVPAANFTANAFFLYGDLNKDIDINIADITTYIDYLLKAKTFTYADSIKADINRDSTIDFVDIDLMKENILNTPIPLSFIESNELTNIPRIDAVKIKSSRPEKTSSYQHATATLEATPLGLRVNLVNEIPVRGIEMRMRLKDTLVIPAAINLQFSRAKQFDIFIRMDKTEMRLLAFNPSNIGIQPGSGPVFRIAGITDDANIDTVQVLLSVESNVAVQPTYSKSTATVNQYPVKFSLKQNYPNPFNGSTTITYDIPDGQRLIKSLVQVYNMLGQKVKTLVSKEHDPGTYTVIWDGTDENGVAVSSGVYFYRLITKNYSTARKMIYVK
jgi:hypothetical protein